MKMNTVKQDVIEAALARGIARVTDPALTIEGQAEAFLKRLANWKEHVPASRHAEHAALLEEAAIAICEPIKNLDREGIVRVGTPFFYKIVALGTPIVEPTQREQHERALQQVWGHGGKFNAAFEVGILFDKVIKPAEQIVGYDHRSVTLADKAGAERVVSRDTVRESGRPAWAYTSQAWHEHNYQSQFTPIEPPAAEPERVGRIGFEFVEGNGFGPVARR
jgi:hypothetical protein